MNFQLKNLHALIACLIISAINVSAQNVIKEKQKLYRKSNALIFLENKGQITDQHYKKRSDIDYKLSGKGIEVFVGKGKIYYQFNKSSFVKTSSGLINGKHVKATTKTYRIDVQLVGANKKAIAIAENQENYNESYRPAQSNGQLIIAHSYNKITYKDVYPNIDWILYVKNNNLEYDFVVRPGGNVKDIKLKYTGANKLFSKNNGIAIISPMGCIEESSPFSYDAKSGNELSSSFKLDKNVVSFNIAHNLGTTVIDPQVGWSTYYGGTSDDSPMALKTDIAGNIYFTGNTMSTSNIATTGAFSTSLHGFRDAFLAKFNSNGQRIWATYFGGTYQQSAEAIDCDSGGNVYIAGYTNSPSNIATSGAYQTSHGGVQDAFITKFDSTGGIIWSTYYGGSGNDEISSLNVDYKGDIYVGGNTSSSGFRVMYTVDGYDTILNSSSDMFIAKFRSSGERVWSTYYGGKNNDILNNIATDKWGNVYAVGATQSDSNIATTNGFQTSISGGTLPSSAFLIKFDSNCHLKWGTYYGDNATLGQGAVCDSNGAIYISGTTSSTTRIASSNCYQGTFLGGNYDVFLAKFDTAGERQWGTYYGGTATDETTGSLSIDGQENILISGYTYSTDHIATTNGDVYQSALAGAGIGSGDAFVAKFNSLGQIIWGTYFGGTGDERSAGNCYSPKDGSIYLCGITTSTSNIAIGPSPYQLSLGGITGSTSGSDGFFTKFNADTIVSINQKYTDTILCSGSTLTVHYTTSTNFNIGNVFTLQLSDSTGNFSSATSIGSKAGSSSDSISITVPSSILPGKKYRIRISASNPNFKSPDDYYNIHILKTLPSPIISSNSPVCIGDTLKIILQNNFLSSLIHYYWTGPGGFTDTTQNIRLASATVAMNGTYAVITSFRDCPTASDSTIAIVNGIYPSTISDSSNSPVCVGDTLHLFAASSTSGITYIWTGPNKFVSSLQDPDIAFADNNAAGKYYVDVVYKGCKSTDSLSVKINSPDSENITIVSVPTDTFCLGNYASFISAVSLSGVMSQYQWMVNHSAEPGAITDTWGTSHLTNGDTVYCVITNTHCLSRLHDTSNNIIVTILPIIAPSVSISASPSKVTVPGQTVTFTATVINGGTSPTFEWYKNGILIPGAITNPYITNSVNNGDVIRCTVVSNAQCVSPNTTTGSSSPLGIETTEGQSLTSIYPNPNNGNFTVKASFNGASPKEATIEVVNVVGQVVYHVVAGVQNGAIEQNIQLGT